MRLICVKCDCEMAVVCGNFSTRPSRSKRRYQAYLDWCDWNDGTFKDFLDWLKITDKDELYSPKECEVISEYKKRWQI